MSIMFPTIFALGIRGLGDHTKLGSSLIVMSIVGGAIMPTLLGWLSDTFSMRTGFIVPLVCFAGEFSAEGADHARTSFFTESNLTRQGEITFSVVANYLDHRQRQKPPGPNKPSSPRP